MATDEPDRDLAVLASSIQPILQASSVSVNFSAD